MIVNITKKYLDDPVFLTALNGLLANLVQFYQPRDIYFIRIDRWFDRKWLCYSGKGRVRFDGDFRLTHDTALDALWKEKLTFPPFNPNRVLKEISFSRTSTSYARTDSPRKIHSSQRTHSAKNLNNRVSDFTNSGLFVWFSSSTAHLEQASVMSYAVTKGSADSWFASFRKKNGAWQVHRVKGIDEKALHRWFPLG